MESMLGGPYTPSAARIAQLKTEGMAGDETARNKEAGGQGCPHAVPQDALTTTLAACAMIKGEQSRNGALHDSLAQA